jgi:hypothetical protein
MKVKWRLATIAKQRMDAMVGNECELCVNVNEMKWGKLGEGSNAGGGGGAA